MDASHPLSGGDRDSVGDSESADELLELLGRRGELLRGGGDLLRGGEVSWVDAETCSVEAEVCSATAATSAVAVDDLADAARDLVDLGADPLERLPRPLDDGDAVLGAAGAVLDDRHGLLRLGLDLLDQLERSGSLPAATPRRACAPLRRRRRSRGPARRRGRPRSRRSGRAGSSGSAMPVIVSTMPPICSDFEASPRIAPVTDSGRLAYRLHRLRGLLRRR